MNKKIVANKNLKWKIFHLKKNGDPWGGWVFEVVGVVRMIRGNAEKNAFLPV